MQGFCKHFPKLIRVGGFVVNPSILILDSLRPVGNYYCSSPLAKIAIPRRISPTITKLEVDLQFIKKKMVDPTKFQLKSAILRYKLGGERFLFTFVLNSGKTFNFDRAVSETLESFEGRIKMNLEKKLKAAEITTRLILPPEFEPTDALKSFLESLVTQSTVVQFRINDQPINITVNPPEVFTLKFRESPLAGFPFHPMRIEHSEHFNLDSSRILWEYTLDRKDQIVEKNKKGKKIVMNPKTEVWHPCGDNFVFTPQSNLVGAHVRFTITPSADGEDFGEPFTAEVPGAVKSPPVSKLLYEERLARLDPAVSADPNTLRIVSYNILADTYTTPEWFCDSPPESLDYAYRMPILETEISSFEADLLCLQEVGDNTFLELEPFLRRTKNMLGVFSSKIGITKEGVAAFYNPHKLNLMDTRTIELTPVLKSLPLWEQINPVEALVNGFNERNTVLQLNLFENKNKDGSLLLLGVTHLYFHPNAHHVRLLQTMACIRTIESRLQEIRKDHPEKIVRVFFAGDFNCRPELSSFRLLTTGRVESNDDVWTSYEPEKLSPGIEFAHQLNLRNSHPGHELTNIRADFEACLDYIFYQPNFSDVIKIYSPPSKATIASISDCQEDRVSLPNFHTASDHLPLIADFKLI